MKILRWFLGSVILILIVALIIVRPIPFLFYHKLLYAAFFGRALYIFVLGTMLCLYRLIKGPQGADRIVILDIIGIMIVGFCAVLTIATGRGWYMDIAIAWAFQSFITTLALAKHLEGRGFEE